MRDNDLGGGLVFFTACLDGEDDRGTVQSTLFVYPSRGQWDRNLCDPLHFPIQSISLTNPSLFGFKRMSALAVGPFLTSRGSPSECFCNLHSIASVVISQCLPLHQILLRFPLVFTRFKSCFTSQFVKLNTNGSVLGNPGQIFCFLGDNY